ncbi:hypothetical protein V8C86DRAFT_2899110 [Haematococcus lacustris]
MARVSCSKEAGRIILWMVWVTVWLITSIYVALSVITFGKLWQAASEFSYGPKDLAKSKIWRAPLTSLVLGSLLTFGFNLMSCVTLIKKSVNRGGPGFGYGFMVAFAFSLSFFLLLCGLVLDGFRDEVRTRLEPQTFPNGTTTGAHSWSTYSSETFVGAEVLSLLSFVTYFLFAIVLVVLQSTVNEQLGIDNASTANPYMAAFESGTAHVPLKNNTDPPVAPPDYEYAQYDDYDQQQQQQRQQQVGGFYQQAGYPPTAQGAPVPHPGPQGYYQQGGPVAPVDYDGNTYPGKVTAQAYASAGFAAIGALNVTSTTAEAGPQGQQAPGYQHAGHQAI